MTELHTRPERTTTPNTHATGSALVVIALLVTAFNLRIGVAAVGPVLDNIRHTERLSATAASLLTTIPVVCFGAFAFLAPALTRRIGLHRLLGLAMAVLTVGILARWASGLLPLFIGTILVGAAIAIANVLLPAAIKSDYAHRTGLMMGLYSTVLFVGASVGSGLTVPLTDAVGQDWHAAMALWAVPAGLAFALWLPRFVRVQRLPATADVSSEQGEPSMRRLLRDRTALAVTSMMGVQSVGYYASLTWVPSLLRDAGLSDHSAGWMLSYTSFPGIVAALAVPTLARRVRPSWLPVLASVLLLAAGYLGLLIAPAHETYLWMTLLGLGQGASITLSLSYIVWRAPDARHTAHLSTMAQGFGYLLAGLGPIGFGALHSISGGWTLPLIALLLLLVVQLLTGLAASRDRHVLSR